LLEELLHPFNGLFSRTTWVSRRQKGKPFWILLDQEMMPLAVASAGPYAGSHLHLTPDSHASTSPLIFLQAGCPSWHPTNSVKALKAWLLEEVY